MRDDALPVGRLAGLGAGIGGVVAAAVLVALLMLHERQVPPGGLPVAPPPPLAPGRPSLQPAPQADLAQYRDAKRQALQAPAGIDSTRGTAHLPIATAMAMRAASGAGPGSSR